MIFNWIVFEKHLRLLLLLAVIVIIIIIIITEFRHHKISVRILFFFG